MLVNPVRDSSNTWIMFVMNKDEDGLVNVVRMIGWYSPHICGYVGAMPWL